ncbi:MAG: hypothetical protein F9K23_07505 [Bacteroidetes bacterium]|nr:MAG: hypothetical protein F9K23_07505 [Bacteroidota bacterium]
MRKNSILLLLVTSLSLYSCSNKKNKEDIYLDESVLRTHIRQSLGEDSTDLYFLILKSDTLEITSNFEWSFFPFGIKEFSINKIQDINHFIFHISSATSQRGMITHRMTFNESYLDVAELSDSVVNGGFEKLAEHNYSKPDKFYLSSALIKDSQIKLASNVKIGINKSDFFRKTIKHYDKTMDSIRVFINNDVLGTEYVQVFIFDGDILSNVLIFYPVE